MNILKTGKRFAGKTVILGLALAILGGCGDQSSTYYDRVEETTRSETIPPEAVIKRVELTDVGKGELQLEFELDTRANFRSKDTLTYVAQFVPQLNGYGDHKSIFLRISPGDVEADNRQVAVASLVNLDTSVVERERPVLRYDNILRVKFPASDLNNLHGFYARSYFRPDKMAAGIVGLKGILASVVAIILPNFVAEEEKPDEQTMVDDEGLDAFMDGLDIDTSGWRRIRFPRGSTCPPSPWNDVTPLDFDNDPGTEEGKYNNAEDNLAGNKMTSILYILSPPPGEEPDGGNSWFQPIVFVDENGNGIADPDEICAETTDAVGQCTYARGVNSWHMDNHGNLQWISRDYDKEGNPTGETTRWEYDPATGNLKKFVDQNTDPSYDGPADGYYWSRRFDGSGCTEEEEVMDGLER